MPILKGLLIAVAILNMGVAALNAYFVVTHVSRLPILSLLIIPVNIGAAFWCLRTARRS